MQETFILSNLEHVRPPIAVKFFFSLPEQIKQIEESFSLCEMIKVAQDGNSFYATEDNFECVGPFILGMKKPDPLFESGQIGPHIGVFDEPRANARLYKFIPMLPLHTCKAIAFAPFQQSPFSPDVVLLTLRPSEAEIILRALTYSGGEIWESKLTPVMGCSWLLVYPYLTGRWNYVVTNLVHGMKARHVFPDGLIIISIPFDHILTLLENLKRMPWHLPEYTKDRNTNVKEFNELIKSLQQKFAK